jgi:hypothetical protein
MKAPFFGKYLKDFEKWMEKFKYLMNFLKFYFILLFK